MPDIFQNITRRSVRSTSWCNRPSNAKQDGTYRSCAWNWWNAEGQPAALPGREEKPLKYDIIARDGYKAKQEVGKGSCQ